LDRRDETPNPLPDITNPEMFLFLAIILHTGHDVCDRFRDYWTRTEQFSTKVTRMMKIMTDCGK
jgi:hypothetical protein